VNIAAGGEVTGQGRRPFPGFPPATRILVIAVCQGLVVRKPQPLKKKERQQPGRDALRQIEAKTAKHAKPKGHRIPGNPPSLYVETRSTSAQSAKLRAAISQGARLNRFIPLADQRIQSARNADPLVI
jgi:hypothetical protein